MRIALHLCVFLFFLVQSFGAQNETEIRMAIRSDPKSFDPLLASEEASEAVRYMTGGVLLRLDRSSQKMRPELAESWRISRDGRKIEFALRKGIRFSDGSPFDSADVAATVQRLNDPSIRSGIKDTFRTSGKDILVETNGPAHVSLTFPSPVAGLEVLFDQLSITSSRSRERERASLGPYTLADYKPGQYVLLRRNPQYWKRDAEGKPLPYADRIRLDILANRDVEMLRFRRGELHMIDKVEPDAFERMKRQMPESVRDAGPSLDSEVLWFNLYPNAPIPARTKRWFASQRFRRAISGAINRHDIARVVYHGLARPAAAYISESNRAWVNQGLKVHDFDPGGAVRSLKQDGFEMRDGALFDRDGNRVQFSLITNSSSRSRVQIAAMLQEDLKRIGIQVNIVPLEFGSLVERITQTRDYEVCLLGFSNIEPEPNSQVNVFLSSGSMHAWNPAQPAPATDWEAEIDELVRKQAGAPHALRKRAVDRIQEILWHETPVIFLVHPNVLVAVSPQLSNTAPSALPPRLYWNIENIRIGGQSGHR